jgi:hypothetical protein
MIRDTREGEKPLTAETLDAAGSEQEIAVRWGEPNGDLLGRLR